MSTRHHKSVSVVHDPIVAGELAHYFPGQSGRNILGIAESYGSHDGATQYSIWEIFSGPAVV